MRLRVGQAAKDFTTHDIQGRPVRLSNYAGQHILLTFVRYAGCAFCGLRIFYLTSRYAALQAQGLAIIAVTESTLEAVQTQKVLMDAPFPIIVDPQREFFHLYGIQTSVWGLIRGEIQHVRENIQARQQGLYGKITGNVFRMPADFLIAPNGRILIAHYGKDLGDYLPFVEIEAALPPAPQPTR